MSAQTPVDAPVLVEGRVRAAPDRVSELREAIRAITNASVDDPGCRLYVFTADLDDPHLFVSAEVWNRQSDLDAHMTHAHTTRFLDLIGDLTDGAPELTITPLER